MCRGPHKRLDCDQRPQDVSLPVLGQQSSKSQPPRDSALASRKRAYQKQLSIGRQTNLLFNDIMELHCPLAITPFNFYTWNLLLADSIFEDANQVLKGMKLGFPLATGDGALKSAKRNCITALRQPEIIDNYLQEEIREGSVAGPLGVPPLPDLHINRFGAIPKSTPGKFRLITDLPFPFGNSVNYLIDDSEAVVLYAGIPEALAMIMKLGQV